MSQINRLSGGQINWTKTPKVYFDAKEFTGHPGNTLTSAPLPNGAASTYFFSGDHHRGRSAGHRHLSGSGKTPRHQYRMPMVTR